MSRVVVTGARGFIGKNLVVALRRNSIDVHEVNTASTFEELVASTFGAEVVFHLAGVNRPERDEEFTTGNVGSIEALCKAIDESLRREPGAARPTVVLASSRQASDDNAYGRSKAAAEKVLEGYSRRTGTPVVIYRLPGVFGKWCRPEYNSVVATFCHNIARDLPVSVSDPTRVVELVYVDDVVGAFMRHLDVRTEEVVRSEVLPLFRASLAEIAERLREFHAARRTLNVPDVNDMFSRRLLSTFSSFLPVDNLCYPLSQRVDSRGALAEVLKSPHWGQLFVSRTHPGVTRGNHYHDSKVEKFCVLEGEAVVRLRPIFSAAIVEHRVSGRDLRVVDIPPGMTHSIENIGSTDMIVLFWASETLDQKRPDTYVSKVIDG